MGFIWFLIDIMTTFKPIKDWRKRFKIYLVVTEKFVDTNFVIIIFEQNTCPARVHSIFLECLIIIIVQLIAYLMFELHMAEKNKIIYFSISIM